jgi:hypothetical protein
MQITTPTSATVIALNRSRAEKAPLLDDDSDVAHERRRAHRMLDSLTWAVLATILRECLVAAFATAGFVWAIAYVTASIRAGVWL